MKKPMIFWLTGLSGAGKSTISNIVRDHFSMMGKTIKIVDGDDVRNKYHEKLGFEFEDVKRNNLLICDLITNEFSNCDIILVPVIAPYEKVRDLIKNKFLDNLFFVYCNANLESVSSRDVKGLYKKAKEGKITNMIGFSDGYDYEIPSSPDLILNTGTEGDTPDNSSKKLIEFIKSKTSI